MFINYKREIYALCASTFKSVNRQLYMSKLTHYVLYLWLINILIFAVFRALAYTTLDRCVQFFKI